MTYESTKSKSLQCEEYIYQLMDQESSDPEFKIFKQKLIEYYKSIIAKVDEERKNYEKTK